MRALSLFLGLALVSSAWGDTVTDARAALDALIAERAVLVKTVAARDATIRAREAAIVALTTKLPAPTTCTHTITLGLVIPWAALPPGAVVCLADGDHSFPLEPPVGVSGITVRAATWGKASVTHIDLANNNIGIDGVAVLHNGVRAVWTRVGP